MTADFYAGRRVLVTGHNGFVGGWLTHWLSSCGAEVLGYSRSARPATVGTPDGVRSVRADIADRQRLATTVAQHRPELIVHLAAQPLVPAAMSDPGTTMRINVVGAINVLDCALRQPAVRAVVLVGSPGATGGPCLDPYAASKCAVTAVASGYVHQPSQQRAGRRSRLAIAIARPGVLLGGGDHSISRVLPDAVRAIRDGQPIALGQPGATRPWQHVLDGVSGMLTLGRAALSQELGRLSYDFGLPDPSSAAPVGRLVTDFLRLSGVPDWPIELAATTRSPGTAGQEPVLGCVDATRELGWQPIWNIQRTLEMTAAWYRGAAAGPASASQLTEDQLARYFDDAARLATEGAR